MAINPFGAYLKSRIDQLPSTFWVRSITACEAKLYQRDLGQPNSERTSMSQRKVNINTNSMLFVMVGEYYEKWLVFGRFRKKNLEQKKEKIAVDTVWKLSWIFIWNEKSWIFMKWIGAEHSRFISWWYESEVREFQALKRVRIYGWIDDAWPFLGQGLALVILLLWP